jgi:serine/threonine-protein kinase
MVTGKKAFEGKSQLSVASAILEKEPEAISAMKPLTPPALDHAIRRCLAKDPDDRWQNSRDLAGELKWIAEGSSQSASPVSRAPRGKLREILLGSLAATFALAAIALGMLLWREHSVKDDRVVRFDISPPERGSIRLPSYLPNLAISPDGTQIVYHVFEPAGGRLYVRNIGSLAGQPIPGTEGALDPFFSPDGRWLAFFASKELKRLSLAGGDASELADMSSFQNDSWGAAWSPDGNIYVSYSDGIYRLPETGGTWEKMLSGQSDKQAGIFLRPQTLPNKKVLLLAVGTMGNFAQSRIVAIRTDTKEQKTLVEGATDPHFVEPGTLVYLRQGTLMAIPFDPDRLEIHGSPVPVLEDVASAPVYGVGEFDVSPSGTLVYFSASAAAKSVENTLVWRNRQGDVQPVGLKPAIYQAPRLSPDGRLLAVSMEGRETEIWIYDLEKGTMRRMTFGPGEDEVPVWSPDGKRIAYSANGRQQAFCFTVDGSLPEEPLMSRTNHFHLYSWSPDGKFIAFESGLVGKFEIWILPMFGDRKPYPYLQNAFNSRTPVFSPDGKWLAYSSNESGQFQIYVQRFPGPGERVQVSAAGGINPVWERNGRALFFRNGRTLMKAAVLTEPTLSAGKPRELFETGVNLTAVHTHYDVSPDGNKFVIVEGGDANASNPLHTVLNWGTEVSKRIASSPR